MLETALFVALLSAGIIIAIHGFLIRRRPQRAHPIFLEAPLFEVLELDDPDEIAKTLGRLRVVYGFFFVLLGLWGVLS